MNISFSLSSLNSLSSPLRCPLSLSLCLQPRHSRLLSLDLSLSLCLSHRATHRFKIVKPKKLAVWAIFWAELGPNPIQSAWIFPCRNSGIQFQNFGTGIAGIPARVRPEVDVLLLPSPRSLLSIFSLFFPYFFSVFVYVVQFCDFMWYVSVNFKSNRGCSGIFLICKLF